MDPAYFRLSSLIAAFHRAHAWQPREGSSQLPLRDPPARATLSRLTLAATEWALHHHFAVTGNRSLEETKMYMGGKKMQLTVCVCFCGQPLVRRGKHNVLRAGKARTTPETCVCVRSSYAILHRRKSRHSQKVDKSRGALSDSIFR